MLAESTPAGDALRSPTFWLLSLAFVLALLSTVAMTIFAIPFLLEQGHSAGFAAFAVGLDRRLADPRAAAVRPDRRPAPAPGRDGERVRVDRRRHRPRRQRARDGRRRRAGWCCSAWATGWPRSPARPTIADLYGSGAYGAIASVAGSMTTAARAAGPFAAAVYAAAVGYTALLWTLSGLALVAALLAHHAEQLGGERLRASQPSQAASSSSAPGTT